MYKYVLVMFVAASYALAGGEEAAKEKPYHGKPARDYSKVLQKYPEADTDGDGKITEEEYRSFFEKRRQEERQKFLEQHPEADADKDGTLSDEEYRAYYKKQKDERYKKSILKRYPDADTDKDGKISDEELAAFRQKGGFSIKRGYASEQSVEALRTEVAELRKQIAELKELIEKLVARSGATKENKEAAE